MQRHVPRGHAAAFRGHNFKGLRPRVPGKRGAAHDAQILRFVICDVM